MSKTKQRVKHPLLLGMAIYTLVFLAAVAAGLSVFWDFIAAYEASRPENVIKSYASQLTAEYIAMASGDLAEMVNHQLQTEEECLRVIQEAIAEEITYAKKTSESTDNRLVYALRCGSRVIGSATLVPVEIDQFGFSHWKVAQEVFSMEYLMGDVFRITVPEDFVVKVNGRIVGENCIAVSDIHYENLEAFYDDYELPNLVTYEMGPFLGDVTLETLDADGNLVVIDETTDYNAFLSNCREEDCGRLAAFADRFLERYVAFTGSAHKTNINNYAKLLPYVVGGSDLYNRMSMALDGLSWAQSKGDQLVSVTYNQFIDIGDGKFICDATYEVDTYGREGLVRTTSYVRFVIVDLPEGPRVEMLTSY